MRYSHPYAWVFLLIAFAIGLVIAGVMKMIRLWRAISWATERARRATWARAQATVQSATRITSVGDFLLVLAVRLPNELVHYRTADTSMLVKGIARLPPQVIELLDGGQLPVMLARDMPEHLAVDLAAIVGDEAANSIERAVYVQHGILKWKPVLG